MKKSPTTKARQLEANRRLQERLLKYLHYDKLTGVLTWLISPAPNVPQGDRAGTLHKKTGYRRVKIFGRLYQEHRLIFFIVEGRWPGRVTDHRNRIKDDNRWGNLRESNFKENIINSGVRSDTKILKGVNLDPYWGVYNAVIMIDGVTRRLGTSKDILEAAYHRLAAEQCLGWESWEQTLGIIRNLEENNETKTILGDC